MDSTISAWGNSLGLRIPKAYAREVGLESGDKVAISVQGDHLLVKPLKKYSLKDLVGEIENTYGEVDFGAPEGKEVW
ncbi:MAG: AbrB/MazE/SpoVT family DNA-binding domain-containing protein [Candidatus Nitrohelix vancouverensis]|uniref:AbrB/MazE/SpoVT family DNA-binding domain-containing protein n=1 Tax=Candidatus Nitrohelix vancouverensis TaxID=2705534 RepID=A0A7T0C0H2_9BACT|nr:MAG: AbrB/MazE/SpoVT family DNA-binding domain-containing protein [Candidatus Nitrohelix vancouverensis]